MSLAAIIATSPDARSRKAVLNQLKARLGLHERREPDSVELIERAMAQNQGYEREISCLVQAMLHRAEASEGSYDRCMMAYVNGEICEVSSGCFDGEVPTRWETGLESLIPWMVADIVKWAKEYRPAARRSAIGGCSHKFYVDDDHTATGAETNLYHGWGMVLIDTPMGWNGFFAIRDWLRGTGTDPMSLFQDGWSLEYAEEQAADWHENIAIASRMESPVSLTGEAYPDRLLEWDDGWHVVQLTTPEHLNAEASWLGHCIETYEHELNNPRKRYLSLRKPDRTPVMTVEQRLDSFVFLPGVELVRTSGEPAFITPDQRRSPTSPNGHWQAMLWTDTQARGKRNMRLLGKYQDKALRMLLDPRPDSALDQDRPRPYSTMGEDGLVLLPPETLHDILVHPPKTRFPVSANYLMELQIYHYLQLSEPWAEFRMQNNTIDKIGLRIGPITHSGSGSIPLECRPHELNEIEAKLDELTDIIEIHDDRFEWVVTFDYELSWNDEGFIVKLRASWGPRFIYRATVETRPGEDWNTVVREIEKHLGVTSEKPLKMGGSATVTTSSGHESVRGTRLLTVNVSEYRKRASINDHGARTGWFEWNGDAIRKSMAQAQQIARNELTIDDRHENQQTRTVFIEGLESSDACEYPKLAERIYRAIEAGIMAAQATPSGPPGSTAIPPLLGSHQPQP